MPIYEIEYKESIEKKYTVRVKADNENDAISAATEGYGNIEVLQEDIMDTNIWAEQVNSIECATCGDFLDEGETCPSCQEEDVT